MIPSPMNLTPFPITFASMSTQDLPTMSDITDNDDHSYRGHQTPASSQNLTPTVSKRQLRKSRVPLTTWLAYALLYSASGTALYWAYLRIAE